MTVLAEWSLVDYRKAFDMIDCDLLQKKLEVYGNGSTGIPFNVLPLIWTQVTQGHCVLPNITRVNIESLEMKIC